MSLWPDIDVLTGSPSLERGRRTLLLHLSRPEWVHRRVESIEFVSDVTVRRRTSSDLVLPTAPPPGPARPAGPVELLPLTLLAKRPLAGLDVRDEDGRPVPVLTRRQNGLLGLELLLAAAELELDHPVPDDVRRTFEHLVVAEAAVAASALAAFDRVGLSTEARRRLLSSPLVRQLLHELSGNFLFLCALAFEPGRRRILKLSYLEPLEAGPNDLAAQLGWRPSSLVFDLPTIGYSSSYHLEVAAPRGLAIVAGDVATTTPPAEPVRQVRTLDRVHFHVPSEAQAADAQAIVEIGVPRRGLLRAAGVTSWAALVLLAGLAAVAERVDDRTNGAVVALLLLVPTLAAAYLVRPGEHGLVSSLLFWGRAAIFLVGLVTLAAATTVALGVSAEGLRTWLVAFAVVATVPTTVLTVALLRGVR